MNPKFIFALFAFLFMSNIANSQYYFYNDKYYNGDIDFEIGASFGAMNSLTDLGGNKGLGKGFIKDLNIKNTQVAAGIYAVATFKDIVGIRLEGTFGNVKGYDSILKGDNSDAKNRYQRNLSFKSPINEFSAMVEFHPLMLKNIDIATDEIPKLSPYIMGGIGFFSFKPQTNLNGTWVNLQPLRTEGQGFAEYPERKKYELSQINIPFGVGVKYELGALFTARFEIVHRVLFTDYLDDVSTKYVDPTLFSSYLSPSQAALAQQLHNRSISTDPSFSQPDAIRGDSKDNDAFFTVNLKLGFNLGKKRVK